MKPIIQKHQYLRNRQYLDYVKSLPSCVSGLPADDPHHIKNYAALTGSGAGIKGDDIFVIPLTRAEHAELHQVGAVVWECDHGSQLEFCLQTIGQALRDGVLKW